MTTQAISERIGDAHSIAISPADDPPNFGPLAGVYRWMEYCSFGPMLERCRFHFLPECVHARRALILGDGDGRFAARFLARNRHAKVDAVDASADMLAALCRRAHRSDTRADTRLHTIQADLRRWFLLRDDYDLVVSHFFLDCLSNDEVEKLVERTVPHLSANVTWLVSEFAVPEGRWRGVGARLLIRFLYFAFRRMTRLRVSELPDYAAALSAHGFRRREQRRFLGGLLVAEIWVR